MGDFASEVVPLLRAEVMALHDGDTAPRKALWSHADPITLFGAEFAGSGWASLEPIFDHLATTLFRREDGAWKVIHRPADPLTPASRDTISARSSS